MLCLSKNGLFKCVCANVSKKEITRYLLSWRRIFFFGVNKLEQTQAQTCNQTDILKFFLKGGEKFHKKLNRLTFYSFGTSKAKTHIHLLGTAQFNLIIISIPWPQLIVFIWKGIYYSIEREKLQERKKI